MFGIGRSKLVAGGIAAVVGLTMTACSSSSKSTSATTTGSPTTSASPAATGSSTSSGSSATPTGTPYKLMWTYTTPTGGNNYTSVIEKGINARGGINGHPLQIVSCADNNNANQATKCAEQAVADPQMLGLIADSSTCSSQVYDILAVHKMASINPQFFCPARSRHLTPFRSPEAHWRTFPDRRSGCSTSSNPTWS